MKTQTPERSIVSQEAQWTQAGTREQSQVNSTHLVRSTDAIVSFPHLLSVKSCLGKSRLIKREDWMLSVMIAIEYSYKLGRINVLIYDVDLAGFCSDSHIFKKVPFVHFLNFS